MLRIVVLLLTILMTLDVLADDLHRERERGVGQSFLLAGNRSYSVHLFRGGVLGHTGGHVICHTAHDSGKMTWLYCTGISVQPTAHRSTYVFKKMCGICVDGDRLFVAAYESPRFGTDDYRRPDKTDLGNYLGKDALRGSFRLLVFSVLSGETIGVYEFPESATDERFSAFMGKEGINPSDHLGHGPIAKAKSGVLCFGRAFRLEDGKLRPEKVTTEPPTAADGEDAVDAAEATPQLKWGYIDRSGKVFEQYEGRIPIPGG